MLCILHHYPAVGFSLAQKEYISKFQRLKRTTRTFGDLFKRKMKELIRNSRNEGFEWISER